jgi:hypothetical protein
MWLHAIVFIKSFFCRRGVLSTLRDLLTLSEIFVMYKILDGHDPAPLRDDVACPEQQ